MTINKTKEMGKIPSIKIHTKDKTKRPDWGIEILRKEQLMRNQVQVSSSNYSQSVQALVNLALQDTSGSKAAAQVLLSLNDGTKWHVDLTDLCYLDCSNLQHALVSLRGCVTLSEYPYGAIENGVSIFAQLERKWQLLDVQNRYK